MLRSVTFPHLTRDTQLLFATRFIRLFAYGSLSVVLVFYLVGLGLSEQLVGVLLTLTLVGDTVISLAITTRADRVGRRRMLIVGALLMTGAGLVFASTASLWALLLAGTIGVLSPSGHEVGPFLPIEQAALSHVVTDQNRTEVFAWYTLTGSFATALGALSAGFITRVLQEAAMQPVSSYRAVVILICGIGRCARRGLCRTVAPNRGGGLREHEVESDDDQWALSALLASRLAARIGLIRTMVFTHVPSNILLILVPLMPSLWWAVAVLLARFSISQMDVPARQSYVMAVVTPQERAAAGGFTGVARTIGASISPFFVGLMFARLSLMNLPFFIAGTLKIVYNVLLYRQFVAAVTPGGGSSVRGSVGSSWV